MRLAFSILLHASKYFQHFVKKTCSLLYPDRGIEPGSGYVPKLEPFSSLLASVHACRGLALVFMWTFISFVQLGF